MAMAPDAPPPKARMIEVFKALSVGFSSVLAIFELNCPGATCATRENREWEWRCNVKLRFRAFVPFPKLVGDEKKKKKQRL